MAETCENRSLVQIGCSQLSIRAVRDVVHRDIQRFQQNLQNRRLNRKLRRCLAFETQGFFNSDAASLWNSCSSVSNGVTAAGFAVFQAAAFSYHSDAA